MTTTLTAAPVAGPEAPRRRCKVGRLLDQADDAGRELFLRRLNADPRTTGWSDDELAKRLGHAVGAMTLYRHRRGVCVCDTDENEDR